MVSPLRTDLYYTSYHYRFAPALPPIATPCSPKLKLKPCSQVTGETRSSLGGKLIATTLTVETEKNRAMDLVAVPCEGGYVGPLAPFFVLFAQPVAPASSLKCVKLTNTSALLNKCIPSVSLPLLPLFYSIL